MSKKGNLESIQVRIDKQDLETIDKATDIGLFKSRSEAIRFWTSKGCSKLKLGELK